MIHPRKILYQVLPTNIQNKKDNHFLKYLKETLNKVTRENEKVILTRDFNLNLKFDSKAEGYFLDVITMKCTLIKPNLQKTLKN